MSISTLAYFHSGQLRQRYSNELDAARQEGRVHADDYLWLKRVTLLSSAADPDSVRVEHLTGNESLQPSELAAALGVSRPLVEGSRFYLFTLANGFEMFSDRQALTASVRARSGEGNTTVSFEEKQIEGDPFQSQMLAIIDQQVQLVGRLTEQLKRIPSLFEASTASLARQMRKTLPEYRVDPATHLLQIIGEAKGDVESALVTQTLASAALDEFCNVQIEEGFERRFLDNEGNPLSADDARLFARALRKAAEGVAVRYGELLAEFWTLSRRDLAAETLLNGFRSDVYSHRVNVQPGGEWTERLLALVRPDSDELAQGSRPRCESLSIMIGDSDWYPLAATFVVRTGAYDDHSLLWFSPKQTLTLFKDASTLSALFATGAGKNQIRPLLALEDQAVLQQEGVMRVSLKPIDGPLFANRVDSIIELQQSNLAYVMGLSPVPREASARIDDALDIRQLLDPRQLQLTAGRWRRDAPFEFHEVWLKSPAGEAVRSATASEEGQQDEAARHVPLKMTLSAAWKDLAQDFYYRFDRLQGLDNALRDHAEQALQQYLCVWPGGAARTSDIQVSWVESVSDDLFSVETYAVPTAPGQARVTMPLASFLLEVVSGHRSRHLAADAQILYPSRTVRGDISLRVLNHMLDKAGMSFIDRYIQRFRQSRGGVQRQGDRQVKPHAEASELRQDAMRLFLDLAKRHASTDAPAVMLVEQVLDRPVRALRANFDLSMTEASLVSVLWSDNASALFCDTLVVTQPHHQNSPVVLWNGERGWRQFASLEQMKQVLLRELQHTHPERWLKRLGERDSRLLRAHLLEASGNEIRIELDKIDGHAIERLQEIIFERRVQDLRQLASFASRCRLEAGLFQRLAGEFEADRQLSGVIGRLSVRISNRLFEENMPAWIKTASIPDLKRFYQILRRLYLAHEDGKNFLFGLPTLKAYARAQLMARLEEDHSGQLFDPDQIHVHLRHDLTSPPPGPGALGLGSTGEYYTESLTDYAINRFSDKPYGALSFSSIDTPQVATVLTEWDVLSLVRGLDVAAVHAAMLREAFSPLDANYGERVRLFSAQLPPRLLVEALPKRLQNELTEQAYEFISAIVDMPDATARRLVNGAQVMLSPLRLRLDGRPELDTIPGVHLICPAVEEGPIVVLVMYHPELMFLEYASRQELLKDLRSNRALQKMLAARLETHIRAPSILPPGDIGETVEGLVQVSERLFNTPRPVTYETREVKGNALSFLLKDTINILLRVEASSVTTNKQDDQAGRGFMMSLVRQQLLSFAPGRLGIAVGAWQARYQVSDGGEAAMEHKWGEALADFTAALGLLTTFGPLGNAKHSLKQEPVEKSGGDLSSSRLSAESVDHAFSLPPFSWRNASLSPEQRMRLQALEAQGVALSEMRYDDVLKLYIGTDNSKYAMVDGKVYQVREPGDGTWIIVGPGGTKGPKLKYDNQGKWELDLSLRLKGGVGAELLGAGEVESQGRAAKQLIVEVSGMKDIRLRYPANAEEIEAAHHNATRCLRNSLSNLNAHQRGRVLDPGVMDIIGSFFGTSIPDQELLTEIRVSIERLLDALLDDSLNPANSTRFIVATNRLGSDAVALVDPKDPLDRIYLTEKFFNPRPYSLKPDAEGFDQHTHFRAATLIHELSHLVLKTEDMAYVESAAPYPDLLQTTPAYKLRIKETLMRTQNGGLSHLTPRDELFMVPDENGQPRDAVDEDEVGVSEFLKLTRTTTLAEGRRVFLSDAHLRSSVMLKNADSLTLLIMKLGRNDNAPPNP
jgi:hypothetical protein